MCIGLHTLPPCLLFCGNYILHESEYDVHIFCVALDIIIYRSPTLSPGKDAGRVCPKALHDAEPTKHTQPFTTGKGFGVRDREFVLSYKKTDFFYKLYVPQHPTAAHFLYVFYTKKRKTLAY